MVDSVVWYIPRWSRQDEIFWARFTEIEIDDVIHELCVLFFGEQIAFHFLIQMKNPLLDLIDVAFKSRKIFLKPEVVI